MILDQRIGRLKPYGYGGHAVVGSDGLGIYQWSCWELRSDDGSPVVMREVEAIRGANPGSFMITPSFYLFLVGC